MMVYHGSDAVVSVPDTLHSLKNLDFGMGFYVTSVKLQAERWAKRKAALQGKDTGYVSVFEFHEDPDFQILNFGENLEAWIDFVCSCRNGLECYKKYDVIIGKVADDKVFRVVDMYKRGIWDKERALREIRVYDTYDQIVFVTQRAIESMLSFKDSFEVLL